MEDDDAELPKPKPSKKHSSKTSSTSSATHRTKPASHNVSYAIKVDDDDSDDVPLPSAKKTSPRDAEPSRGGDAKGGGIDWSNFFSSTKTSEGGGADDLGLTQPRPKRSTSAGRRGSQVSVDNILSLDMKRDEEADAKERVEREAKERVEREAKERVEREAKERVEREAREAKERVEREAKERVEREAKERVEREAREAKERVEREAKEAKERWERDEREAKERQEREAKERVEREAKERRERDEREAKEAKERWEVEEREAKAKRERDVWVAAPNEKDQSASDFEFSYRPSATPASSGSEAKRKGGGGVPIFKPPSSVTKQSEPQGRDASPEILEDVAAGSDAPFDQVFSFLTAPSGVEKRSEAKRSILKPPSLIEAKGRGLDASPSDRVWAVGSRF
jgi:hypothetical protein